MDDDCGYNGQIGVSGTDIMLSHVIAWRGVETFGVARTPGLMGNVLDGPKTMFVKRLPQ
eukprot:gene23063-27908_t